MVVAKNVVSLRLHPHQYVTVIKQCFDKQETDLRPDVFNPIRNNLCPYSRARKRASRDLSRINQKPRVCSEVGRLVKDHLNISL